MAQSCFFIWENDKRCLVTKRCLFCPCRGVGMALLHNSAPFSILCWLTSAHNECTNQDLQLRSWRRPLPGDKGWGWSRLGTARGWNPHRRWEQNVFLLLLCVFLIEKAACCPSASPAALWHTVPCGLQPFGQCCPFGSAACSSAGAVRWGAEHS